MPIRRSTPFFSGIRALLFISFSALLASAGLLSAQNQQNVEVRNAGGGNKEELVRNAAGQVVETRTVDADGKVRSRNSVEYIPGHYAPDTTTTSYYADGKSVENFAKVTYDPSANFLSETVRQYLQSGKQISGHKILHDPVTGEFRCWKWNPDAQKDERIVCPSGEESGEKPPPLKRLTQDEAVKLLESARTAAAAEQKQQRMTPKNPTTPQVKPKPTQYSVVLPADLVGGKQVSGSIVDDTHYIRLRPELIIENITLPLDPGGNAAKLSGWRIEVAGSQASAREQSFHLHGSQGSIEHRRQDLS